MSDPRTELGVSPLMAGDRNLSVDEARAAIAAALQPITASETVPLSQALGRVLAADLLSPIDVPAHDNSAMDGYAFAGCALQPGEPTTLRAVGTLFAGAPWAGAVGAGECLRIMTGAVMPEGADTVVPLELAQPSAQDAGAAPSRIRVPAGAVVRGAHRRRRGEDLAAGATALAAGRWLRPADIGLAASLGLTALDLRPRLRVALLSTGDELAAPGAPRTAGQVYDSNRHALGAALARMPVEVVDLGLRPDRPDALEAALRDAATRADVVLTTGGVSAGDADHVRDVLARLGEVAFWKVAMRPGRPFAFGSLHGVSRAGAGPAVLFALPGNPVAALVAFLVFVREPLLALAGIVPPPRPAWRLPCAQPISKRAGRTEYLRARFERATDGSWSVRPLAQQGAGILSSLSAADALLVLDHDRGAVAAGAPVEVWPLADLL
jgi:molybdopterin molybdotransferase